MPYVLESNRNNAYTSVSGLGDFGVSEDLRAKVKAAVKKLQGVVGVSTDGKYGSGTHTKFVAWAKLKFPGLPESAFSPQLLAGQLVATGRMTVLDVINAQIGWSCFRNPTTETCKGLHEEAATPVTPAIPAEEVLETGAGPVVEEEVSFFDKYWWLIAVGALSVGGFVFWRMQQKKTQETVVAPRV